MAPARDLPPHPAVTPDSEAYWANLDAGIFAIQRCRDCRAWQFPMLERCRECGGPVQMEPISGRGTVHTFIVQHHRVAPGFDGARPYVIALVAIDEAPHLRVSGRVVGANSGDVQIGARVQAEIVPLEGGRHKIPVFRLV